MRILCALSSVEFNVEHFPGTFYSREIAHPVFDLPQKKLLSYTSKWAAGELTTTDSYLLFLALLRSTELIEWRAPITYTAQTNSIVANNMEALLRIVFKLNTISNYTEILPHYAVSSYTADLANVKHWIENWMLRYEEHKAGYKSAHESAIIVRRESALGRMIKSPHKSIKDYAGPLADWAIIAGNFPTFIISSPFGSNKGQKITCAEFWREIIVRCTKDEYIFSVPDSDLQELITHCEEHISRGSIYSHALFKALYAAKDRKLTFLDLGDPDVKPTYQVLESSATAESANLRALIDSAPQEEPTPEKYPTAFAYRRAKLRWDMAQKYKL